jgi:serine/threonine-protein kinase
MPLLRAADIAGQILAGLAAAHAAGVVHADIKSDNILVDPRRDGSDAVKIIDFGLASIHQPGTMIPELDHDAAGHLMMSGTPEYMAPEVIRGEGALPASDIYAVGVIIYEMLIGTTPFCGAPSVILESHLRDHAVRPTLRCRDRFIPAAFERALMKALEKDPSRRHANASAFAAAILAATPSAEPTPVARYPLIVTARSSTSMMTRDLLAAPRARLSGCTLV